MRKWIGYQKGINLGGWLSQCVHTKEHYDTFITESDIKTIAGWGLDHVRLPIDYNLIQDNKGDFIESGFAYIDSCIDWCGKYGLNMVLDLHKTCGYSFDEGEQEFGFFQSDEMIARFKKLWDKLAQRYGKFSGRLAFELLNEVVSEEDNAPWMKIAEDTIRIIRGCAPDIKILVGSYMNNSAKTVKCITVPVDENIVFNFHCYDPLLFTHQGAYWIKNMPADYRLSYPMSKEKFTEAVLAFDPKMDAMDDLVPDQGFCPEFFRRFLAEAIRTAEDKDVMLYCGEYGVIELCDPESLKNWFTDIHAVFEEFGIGRAVWSYKKMDFGISDSTAKVLLEDPLKYL